MEIYQDIDRLAFEEIANNYNKLYFAKQNISFKHYRGYASEEYLYITDLSNALQPGKEVTEYVFKGNIWDVLYFTYDLPVSEVLEKLYRQEVNNIEYNTRQHKSIRVFTPFTKLKPINEPKRWTLAHVWKAILSGQIKYGQTKQRLTDDYAWDAATNFGKGQIDVLSFAREIIENPSGWRVSVDKQSDKLIKLSVNCHSFDFKTLIFRR